MYSTYKGLFKCHTCAVVVQELRFWKETKDLTWRCPDGHTSKVELATRKERAKLQRSREERG